MSGSGDDPAMRELARQLRAPQGEGGSDVARVMHASNLGMTRACFVAAAPRPGHRLLEIGHGSGMHVEAFFDAQPALRYVGLELSALMHAEAGRANRGRVQRGEAAFLHYGGGRFPLPGAAFDRAMTVNTIYFLDDPAAFFGEIRRVLAADGLLAVAFADAGFMRGLPFVRHGFRLYRDGEVEALLEAAGFRIAGTERHREWVESKAAAGQRIRRPYSVVRALAAA